MRKSIIASLAIGAISLAPAALAHDGSDDGVKDADQCSQQADPASVWVPHVDDEQDRGHACVQNDGEILFYIGGEVQSEDHPSESAGGACGAIVVAGEDVTTGEEEPDRDWNSADHDNDGDVDEDDDADSGHCE